jgi:hypothetical protein
MRSFKTSAPGEPASLDHFILSFALLYLLLFVDYCVHEFHFSLSRLLAIQ